jgi:hypothetical protein
MQKSRNNFKKGTGNGTSHGQALIYIVLAIKLYTTEGPTTKNIFLGLEIDTVLLKVKIPEDKLNKLRLGIQYILEHKKMKFKELESIVGLIGTSFKNDRSDINA